MSEVLKNRVEFSVLMEVINGNPNGDPDNANRARVDDETGFGIISDVCTKRKIRNYVKTVKKEEDGFRIYINNDEPLNEKHKEAWAALKKKDKAALKKEDYGKLPKEAAEAKTLQKFMADQYFDIRAFGAVMSTEVNCGVLTGPIQINFGRSIDPVTIQDLTITRHALTTKKDFDVQENTMGAKSIIPYGLYRIDGYVSPGQAEKTGFTEEDLQLVIDALQNMYEIDHAAQRGQLNSRKVVVYKHQSALGEAPSWKVFDSLKVEKKPDVTFPRKYDDYQVTLDTTSLPESIQVEVYE